MNQLASSFDIYTYDDYRIMLQDIQDSRRKANSQYSFRKFGKDLGFSAPGYIKDVIEGKKNLGSQGVSKVMQSLGLNNKERTYFEMLVDLNHCKNDTERVLIVEKLNKVFASEETRLINDATAFYLTNRMCVQISILITIYEEKFRPDPIWIMRRLRLPSQIEEINQALHFLLQHHFIRKEDGRYRNMIVNIATLDEKKSQAIQIAHKNILQESMQALDFPLQDREFANVTVCMGAEHLDELKYKIKKFRDEIKLWVNNKSKNSKDYVGITVNVQMYPFTTEMKS